MKNLTLQDTHTHTEYTHAHSRFPAFISLLFTPASGFPYHYAVWCHRLYRDLFCFFRYWSRAAHMSDWLYFKVAHTLSVTATHSFNDYNAATFQLLITFFKIKIHPDVLGI